MTAIDEYLALLERRRALLLETVAGLPSEALDWTPLPAQTSSVAMLTRHVTDDLCWWLVEELVGGPIGYNRGRAFATARVDAATLCVEIDGAFSRCAAA